MSAPHRIRGIKVLKAVSSSIRLQILNLLFDRGSLSYTELMNSLKMNPSREAGRFAYHLKFLLKADLIEVDIEARKYCLTDLGKLVIDVADRVEKKAFKPKSMLVRASRLALEEFDINRIADSLMKEARMPAELAQKVAKEAEKRLLKSRTKYLTAPLVREVVNAILVEKGFEEYRHELTRLGLPVHEVAALIENGSKTSSGSTSVHGAAGDAVLREYTLLKVLPRDIADAHLSGALHVSNLGSWVLKPNEVVHDLRFFYQNGMNLEGTSDAQSARLPSQSFERALSAAFNVLLDSVKEVGCSQTLEYFNVFLAPFAKKADAAVIKEALRSFILNLSHHLTSSLALELTVPDFIADKSAVGPEGKSSGRYGDFVEEAQLLASLVLDVIVEEGKARPLFNPRVTVKVRSDTFSDERAKALLLKAHCLASEKGTVYFACLLDKNRATSTFSGYGTRFDTDPGGDWEIDTLRTGCLGMVAVNLPRIAYECEKDGTKFLELLRERLEMATRALEIKYNALRQNGAGLLPFLMQTVNGDRYLRLEECLRLIEIIGLKEALESFYGRNVNQDEKAQKFAEEIARSILDFTHKVGKRRGRRSLPAMLPDAEAAERMAQLDIDRYGFGKVKFSGTREKPFYSSFASATIPDSQVASETLAVNPKQGGLWTGGELAVIELGEVERKPTELMSVTLQIAEKKEISFFTYNRKLTCCSNCRNSCYGSPRKCPSCNAVGTLTVFDRFGSL